MPQVRAGLSKEELPLLFAVFLDLVGFGMAFPDLQLRAADFARAEGFAYPGIVVGVLLSSYFAVQLLASPRWGGLSDRIGRKPVLLICTALSALSMLVYAWAETTWLILLSRVVAGLAAANVVAAQAYAADCSRNPEERAARQGRISSALMLGLIAGPAIGGWLAHTGGNELLGYAAASASALSLLWIALAVPHIRPQEKARNQRLGWRLLKELPDLRRPFFYAAGLWTVLATLEGTFGRLIRLNLGLGQLEFGWIFSYESALGALAGLALGYLSRKFNHTLLLKLAFLSQTVGLVSMPYAPALWVLFVLSTFYALGLGLANPLLNAECSERTPEERQGEVFGLLQATRSIGFLFGPTIGGLLFDLYPPGPYLLAGGVALLLAAVASLPKSERGDPVHA